MVPTRSASTSFQFLTKLLTVVLTASLLFPGPLANAGWWWPSSNSAEEAKSTQGAAEVEGVVYTFDGTKVEGNPLLNDSKSSVLIHAPVDGVKQADPHEALILDVDTVDLDRTPEETKRGLLSRFKDAMKFGRKSEKVQIEGKIEVELMPEDPTALEKLKQFSDGDVMSFLNTYKSIMGKATYIAKKAQLPENEMTDILSSLSKVLWAASSTIISANARAMGIEVLAYGGGGSSTVFKKLAEKIYLGKLFPESHNYLFTGTTGINILRVKDAKGRVRTFVEFPVAGHRSTRIRTIAGLGGHDVLLTRTWMTNVDPATGKAPETTKATQTMVLGPLGTVSHGEGIFTISLNSNLIPGLPIVTMGATGISFPPMIGAVSFYETAGKRKSLLTVGMTKITDNMVTNSLKASYAFTKDFFGYGRGAKCEALFLP